MTSFGAAFENSLVGSHENIPGSIRWDSLGENRGGSLRDSLLGSPQDILEVILSKKT